ncbi:DNA adenine methylase [uncultured Treponema sp.]|uniref:DNA adenine methylase n=1 Tax=uncultured Treponema sp. TaxID=162155 RepID=UPI0015BC6420|nr:DNA adenine methylase [uncultured Treponema sp.]
MITTKINNRRYLGNKYKLLPFIKTVISKECGIFDSFADIFAGTGAVASAYTDKQIITNDILYSNYLCHLTWFSNEKFDSGKIESYINYFNSELPYEDNYMTQNFSDTYFSKKVCSKIGFIREYIEAEFNNEKINQKEKAMLITSLLYGLDKIANTCGHYDAYRQNVELTDELTLAIPEPNLNLKSNRCFNCDTNELVKEIYADVVYIDPPYNSRQYCDAYHLVENIARWNKPEVFGIAKKMDRSALKSKYCTRSAPAAFNELIENINSKYIVVSYNNMAKKGNDRSNARISDSEIMEILKKKGNVKVYSEQFKAFTTGKSEHLDNEERLFVCRIK